MAGIAGTARKAVRLRGAARLAVAGAVVAASLLVAAQAASASWQDRGTPVVPGATVWSLNAVSCTSPSWCMTVGGSDSSTYPVLSEIRNNATYTLQSVPDPGGANLSSVSCTSTSACTAVGDYNNGTATVTLAERWNGASWSIQPTPNPSGGTNTVLNRVACASSVSCIAVGGSFNGTVETNLAEAWNGASWSIQTTPNVSGQTINQLNGLACTATASCIAVGYDGTGSSQSPLAEAWNGSSWTIQTVPSPGGSSFNPLNGVSCTAATACTAVGAGFAERWNGSSWSVQAVARTKDTLSSVSCVTATSCTAVGYYYKAAIETMTAETWNGTKWREDNPAVSVSYDSDGLSDVSCQNINACTAVGFYHDPVDGNRPLVEIQQLRWHPAEAPVPSGALATGLQTVSCPTAKACMAVGGYEASGSTFPDLRGGLERHELDADEPAEPQRQHRQRPAGRVVLGGERLHRRR